MTLPEELVAHRGAVRGVARFDQVPSVILVSAASYKPDQEMVLGERREKTISHRNEI